MFRALPCLAVLATASVLGACSSSNDATPAAAAPQAPPAASTSHTFNIEPIGTFAEPWAFAFLPDGRLLVTEKAGQLQLFDPAAGASTAISGVPQVKYEGQGGLGDVALHPQFATNHEIYLSYAEPGEGNLSGAALARAQLVLEEDGGGRLEGLEVIWRQVPKFSGRGHYAHRILFDADGTLWLSSGERQQFEPSQDMTSNAGKLLRLNADGTAHADNPFADEGEVAAQAWVVGLRNPLGIAFDPQGQLWEVEMGPAGGDELNRIERGANYGYPVVSNGNHYDGRPIPDHDTRPEFSAPVISWTPVISPSSLTFYTGQLFPNWHGNAFISGLSSQSLVRVTFDGEVREAERFDMGKRIRGVKQGPDDALYLIEDGEGGRLLKLTPAS